MYLRHDHLALNTPEERSAEMATLQEQLQNPDWCYVEMLPGKYFVHSRTKPDDPIHQLDGKPVRFSRLAAERMIKQFNLVNARLVEEATCFMRAS